MKQQERPRRHQNACVSGHEQFGYCHIGALKEILVKIPEKKFYRITMPT